MGISGGGSGKLGGGLVFAGDGWFVGGERLILCGHGLQLRRGFYGSPVHETTGKRSRVSAVSMVSKMERSEGRGKRRHDEFVLDANLRLRRLGE